MPALLRGIARTAVVAGTATAVSGRVQRRQASRYAERDAQIAADRNAAYQRDMAGQAPTPSYLDTHPAPVIQPAAPAAPAPAAAPSESDVIAQLKDLGALRDSGVLTDAEFDAEKAKILAR